MRRVDIPDLEPGPIPCEATRPQGAQPAFMRELGQGIGLVHELGELAAAEELFDSSRDRFKANQVVRHNLIQIMNAHPLPDGPLHADQTDAELILQ